MKPSPPTESQVELADISLEQDKTELDAFLRSDTDTGKYMALCINNKTLFCYEMRSCSAGYMFVTRIAHSQSFKQNRFV